MTLGPGLERVTRGLVVAALGAWLFWAVPARAQVIQRSIQPRFNTQGRARFERHLELGLGAGVARALGRAWPNVAQSSITEGIVRLHAEVGMRFSEPLVIGLYGGLGLGSEGNRVDEACRGAGCLVQTLEVGVQGRARLLPGAVLCPWLGGSAGADILVQTVEYGSAQSLVLYGPAIAASIGAELDFERFSLGPYATYRVGWYTSVRVRDRAGEDITPDIDGSTAHGWLLLGVSGSFALGS